MKYVFLAVAVALTLASILTWWLQPDLRSDRPVIYWVTDPNPARVEQVRIFHEWLRKNDYPRCELRLDTANEEITKKLIQGVSGVAGDIIDLQTGSNMRFLQAVGMLADVTEAAQEHHFDPSVTYPAMHSDITLDGIQYMFPCNVAVRLYWVNKATFRQYGCAPPPRRMSIETFERLGNDFVAAANPPGHRRTVFFCNEVSAATIRRSLGVSMYNETMTRCTLDDQRAIQTWKLLHKWIFDDHIIPTPAESESFSAAMGYGGSALQLFNNGNYGMILMGRYALIQLREFGGLELAVCQPPHGGFPNCYTATRAAAIYQNSEHAKYAEYFLAYLAGKDYCMQIVRDGDSLPPNPLYTKTQAFYRPLPLLPTNLDELFEYSAAEGGLIDDFKQRFYAVTDTLDREEMLKAQQESRLDQFVSSLPAPPKSAAMSDEIYRRKLDAFRKTYANLIPQYQNEWGCHEAFSQAGQDIAIAVSYSPFVIPSAADRIELDEYNSYMAGLYSAEKAARLATKRVNDEIDRTLQENPTLRRKYRELCEIQDEIDRKRTAGDIIPLENITNPFYRRYYVHKGWAR